MKWGGLADGRGRRETGKCAGIARCQCQPNKGLQASVSPR
jgi:hypothetical protein